MKDEGVGFAVGASHGSGKGGGGRGGKGEKRLPPHLMKFNAYQQAGMSRFVGGGAMGFSAQGPPKHNARGPK